jgi:hypothetical protein
MDAARKAKLAALAEARRKKAVAAAAAGSAAPPRRGSALLKDPIAVRDAAIAAATDARPTMQG